MTPTVHIMKRTALRSSVTFVVGEPAGGQGFAGLVGARRGPSVTLPPLSPVTGCLRPLASSNGYANISELQTSFPVGTVISYHCFPGYKLEGAERLECLHSLIWSTSPPRCLALEGNAFSLWRWFCGCFRGR